MALVEMAAGNYHFLPGGGALPFCGGVIADPGYMIVRARLRRPLPWRDGFGLVERHLAAVGRPRTALCAVELRCGKQYTREQFFDPAGFNGQYGALLREWGLVVDGLGSTARTNIAVDLVPLPEQVMYAFGYTVPAPDVPSTFVVSGSPEASGVRPGETSPEALREKTRDVVATLGGRLETLGVGWDRVTGVGLYSVHDFFPVLRAELLERMGWAALNGVHWLCGQPPVEGPALEIDVRGVRTELEVGNS